jgi:uncharacterized membrane protein
LEAFVKHLNKLLIFLLLAPVLLIGSPAQAQQPVVRAVLFYSPTCTHCHKVMEQDLPPLVAKYPGQLDIVGVDVSQAVGQNLYQAALTQFNVSDDRIGVPTLIVGAVVLVGSEEIPAQLPGLVEKGLAVGGIDWPEIPGLQTVLAAQPSTTASSSQSTTADGGQAGFIDKFQKDPLANTIAVIVLIAMVIVLVVTSISFLKGGDTTFIKFPGWVIPLLAVAGMGVALYLSYIEITKTEAICGPVGNCNSVQESPYAILFGVLPVGVLGAIGYLAILIAWLLQQFGPQSLKKLGALSIWGFAWFGLLFSIYLTFLEPFVIGATCAWCITSAIVMTLMLLAATAPAKASMKYDEDFEDDDEEDVEEDGLENPA